MINQIKYTSNYKKILTVEIMHDYFENGLCSSFEINPSSNTRNILKDYGIIFRKIINGFVLISNRDERFTGISFNGPIQLTFKLTNNDPLFFNYTDLNLEGGTNFLFQNNNKTNLLHQKEYVDKTSMVNNNGFLSGEIKIELNSNNEFFGEESSKKNLVEKKFNINFKSRDIIIRYNLYSSKEDFNYSNLFVTDDENTIKISSINKRNLSSGRQVFTISQKKQIKSSQIYKKSFFLKKQDKFLNTFSIQLPNPEPKNMSFDKEIKKFIAEVFVSLD
ncbi:MAG: hypothetical protein CMC10_05030 [Flavobacteriaceae bacterium]|nr:hypothetical protein [Flavobacteriaceae bacterium]